MKNKKKTSELVAPPSAEVITTDTVVAWLDEAAIAVFLAKGNQTIDDARQNIAALRQLTKGKKGLLLLDFSNVNFIPKEARDYYSSEENCSLVYAIAIVTNSLIGKLIGNFFLGPNKNKVGTPIRMFTNVEAARKWLLQIPALL